MEPSIRNAAIRQDTLGERMDDALEMPEAMHAHASITVPLLPPPRPPPLG